MSAFFPINEIDFKDYPLFELSKSRIDIPSNKKLDAPIAKEINNNTDGTTEIKDVQPIRNKIDGLRREADVEAELKSKYPESAGYKVIPEAYLRDAEGNIVKDADTDEARRIDFVVAKDGTVVDSIEVTSLTAPKDEQCAKEARIREAGGNFIKDPDTGQLIKIPDNVVTHIERRE